LMQLSMLTRRVLLSTLSYFFINSAISKAVFSAPASRNAPRASVDEQRGVIN
jgi:hypothetical protein